MDKSIQTELKLGEEQLQEITGGCGECTTDLVQTDKHFSFANAYNKVANNAIAKDKDPKPYTRLALGHEGAAINLVRSVASRGHIA